MDLTTPGITTINGLTTSAAIQAVLDTLTAYITVNVAVNAIDAGKRLKGGEMTAFKQEHVILSKCVLSTLAQFRWKEIDLKDYKEIRSFVMRENISRARILATY